MAGSRAAVALVLGLFAALGLAGCLGDGKKSSGGEEGDDGLTLAPPETRVSATTGAIEGFVADTGFVPLAGATVSIVSLGLNVTTDELGQYAISDLEPGSHIVIANKTGFGPKAKPVQVTAGQVVKENFLLESVAHQVPYIDTPPPFEGYISCTLYAGFPASCTADPNHKTSGIYDANEGLLGIMVEIVWNPQEGTALNDKGPNGSGGMTLSVTYAPISNSGSGAQSYFARGGEPPLKVYLTRERTDAGGYDIHCREGCVAADLAKTAPDITIPGPISFAGDSASINWVVARPFTVYISAFYYQYKPEAYTAIPE